MNKLFGIIKIGLAIMKSWLPNVAAAKGNKLNILFLVRRYHTNMIPMVESLKQAEHEVAVVVSTSESLEDYQILRPIQLNSDHEMTEMALQLPFKKPHLVLIRELSSPMIQMAHWAERQGATVVQYDQKPLRRPFGIEAALKDLKRLRANQLAKIPLTSVTPVDHHASIQKNLPQKYLRRSFNFPVVDYPKAELNPPASSERIKVLMVGKLAQPRKRHFWFINALKSSGLQIDLKICGAGLDLQFDDGTRDGEYYFDLKKCAESSCDSDPLDISLHEDVNFYDLSAYYSEAEIFALPALNEEFGISVLEAMAHSCAVVVSDACGSARHITDGVDGMVFPSADYAIFEQKVHQLLRSEALRVSIQKRAKLTIARNHNYEQFARFIENLI